MWRYGEVLLPLPQNLRRVDVSVGTAPAEEVRYQSASGGVHYSDGAEKLFIWRTKGHQVELFDFHTRSETGSDGVVVSFPRHVQVLPHVAVEETDRGIVFCVATQASFHIIELAEMPGSSILSDLTSSKFKKSFHLFKAPLPVVSANIAIDPDRSSALLVAAPKNGPTYTYSLQRNTTNAEINELKTQTMFGRLLWAGSGDNHRPKSMHVAKIGSSTGSWLVIAICNDLFIRIWDSKGECLFTANLDQITGEDYQITEKDFVSIQSKVTQSDTPHIDVFIQVSNFIHKFVLSEENGKCVFNRSESVWTGSGPESLKHFKIIDGNIWTIISEDEVEVVKILENSASGQNWVEVTRPLPPPDYIPDFADLGTILLQSSRIIPSAVRSALSQISHDNILENISKKQIENILKNESHVTGSDLDQTVADFYQLVLQYNDRSLTVSGLIGGRSGDDLTVPPMVLRRNAVSIIRPLTGIEAVCAGLPMDRSGLNLAWKAGGFLTDVLTIFNRIIFSSGIMEQFSAEIRAGGEPFNVARDLQRELGELIDGSGEGDLLKAEIYRLRSILNAGADRDRMSSALGPILQTILTQIELSPITKDFVFEGEINTEVAGENLTRLRYLAHSVRSVAYNMLNLSQLLLLMVGYLVQTENEDLVSLEVDLAEITNNFFILDWVCSARAIWRQKSSKSDTYVSTINFSNSNFDISNSTITMASLSGNNMFQSLTGSEEHLLELWLAHVGEQQVKQLIELVPSNVQGLNRSEKQLISEVHGTLQLLSHRNRMLSLPVYFLETNQIDLLEIWVQLTKGRSTECQASIDYLDGICKLHRGKTNEAIDAFIAATANLREDFFLTFVLKDAADENINFLRTTYFVQIMDKFKDHTEECARIAQLTLDLVDPTDDRISLLWNKVFLLRLEMEDYPSAYCAMTANPDNDRKKDCLRKFVLHLSEKGDLAPLVEAPYGGLEEEITSILENRAIAVSTKDTRYFDLLFAFHITKENYRQAARAMYLQAQHLKNENDGIQSLQVQEAALLTAINCILLAKPEDQWVSIGQKSTKKENFPKSPKRDYDGNEVISPLNGDITVTTVQQMEKELIVVQARMLLADRNIESGALEPSEVASLLCKEGLYSEACGLLTAYGVPVTLPVKLLARSYSCQISRPDGEDLRQKLEDLLECEELRAHSTLLYHVAAEEILKIGQMVPTQMAENYKKRDTNEYLRLMAKFGEIEEAVDVSCDILDRAVRKLQNSAGGDIKGEHQNHLPVLIIEKLNYFTKLNNVDLNRRLGVKMDAYLEALKRMTRSNVQHVTSVY